MLEELREMLQAVQLVPKAYETYHPLIVDGLMFFLERLPEERLGVIIEEQLSLAGEMDSDERVVALLRQCPTLHKLGQVIARDRGLPSELRERLQRLESVPPTTEFAEVAALIRSELGDAGGVDLANEALAEGSVAVVVPFDWPGASPGMPARGVFKILKPHVKERLLEELKIWTELGGYLEERSVHYGLPALDYRDTLDGVRNLLLNEIRLDLEQERLAWAKAFYADSSDVLIPQVLPLSTPNMTAMERVDGRKVTDSGLSRDVRRRLAQTAIEALIAKPFWNASNEPGRFHADPHAGNLFVTDDGRLAILDWALTTELTKSQRADVVQTLIGAATLDEGQVTRSITALGRVMQEAQLHKAILEGVRQIRLGTFPGFDWFIALLDRLARNALIYFPEETALFRKSLLTLSGVVRDISEQSSIDDVLIRSGLKQFSGEFAGRALAPAGSRDFGSHVSNVDLLRVVSAVPLVPTRYWLETWRDLLDFSLKPL